MADSDSIDDAGRGHGEPAGAPRWVKVSGIIVLVLVVLVGIVLLAGGGGGHGPGRHLGGDGGAVAPVLSDGGGEAPAVGGHVPPPGAPDHGGSQP